MKLFIRLIINTTVQLQPKAARYTGSVVFNFISLLPPIQLINTSRILQKRKKSMGDNDDSGDATIQLDTMSLDQLQQLQQREEGRLQALTNRYAQLRSAAVRLQQSCIAVRAVETTSQNNNDNDKNNIPIGLDEECSTKDDIRKDVFVPLTESVYVPGTISLLRPDDRDLLVELGTGFFVDKTSKETVELLERKMKIVDDNSVNGMFFWVGLFVVYLNRVPLHYNVYFLSFSLVFDTMFLLNATSNFSELFLFLYFSTFIQSHKLFKRPDKIWNPSQWQCGES